MKKINFLVLSVLLFSFNIQAVPPPPPMPQPTGFLTANLSLEVNVTDLKKCEGYFCDQVVEKCTLTTKVPVIVANQYDQGYNPETARSVDGKTLAFCEKLHGGLIHSANLGIYATLDVASNKLKIITTVRSGKRTADGTTFTLDDSARNLVVVDASTANLKFVNYVLNQVHAPYGVKTKEKTVLGNTNHTISADVTFPSLVVE